MTNMNEKRERESEYAYWRVDTHAASCLLSFSPTTGATITHHPLLSNDELKL